MNFDCVVVITDDSLRCVTVSAVTGIISGVVIFLVAENFWIKTACQFFWADRFLLPILPLLSRENQSDPATGRWHTASAWKQNLSPVIVIIHTISFSPAESIVVRLYFYAVVDYPSDKYRDWCIHVPHTNLTASRVETLFICRIFGKDSNSQFSYAFDELDNRNISSTNKLERLNRAIRRWSSIVGIFRQLVLM